jgi:hypothetical protein
MKNKYIREVFCISIRSSRIFKCEWLLPIFKCEFVDRYGNKPSLGGIELMNEPQGVNLDSLKKYYKAAYDVVRKYNPNAYVIMSNPLDADSKVLLSFVSGFNKVVLDVHYYNLYSDKFTNMNVQQNIDYIYNERASDLSGVSSSNALSFVGKCKIFANVIGLYIHKTLVH